MSIESGALTASIIQNIRQRVNIYNTSHPIYVRDYGRFMSQRANLVIANNLDYSRLLDNLDFSNQLHDVLKKFGMNARGALLVSPQIFFQTIRQVGAIFELLNTVEIRLYSLDLHQIIEDRTIYSIIGEIFNFFQEPGNLSEAGGFIVASKTMHFIMPELFIMLDGQHIAVSLYNISDYDPHPDDGRTWFNVIPDYSGQKPNPSPRGGGRQLWNNERYCIALMFYKRIIREWCQRYNFSLDEFLNLDTKNAIRFARIIDKILW